MRAITNFLCILVMFSVASAANADIRTWIAEDGTEMSTWDDNYHDPRFKYGGGYGGDIVVLPTEQSMESAVDRAKKERLMFDIRSEASRQGMSVSEYLEKKLNQIK